MASTVVAHSWAAMASAIAIGILTAIAWNLIKQIFFPDSSRPPVVFHWLPLIGSTVYYGKDPYKFFFECRKKASLNPIQQCACDYSLTDTYSTVTASPLSCLAGPRQSFWALLAMSSSSMARSRTSMPKKSSKSSPSLVSLDQRGKG